MNTELCPVCDVNTGIAIEAIDSKPVKWRCMKCNFEWDINEDFLCVICGKKVPGRILTCSESCSRQFNDPTRDPDTNGKNETC